MTSYHRGVEALEWTGFGNDAIKMAGHWFKVEDQNDESNAHKFVYGVQEQIWSVNANGQMQYRKGVTQTEHRGVEWLRTDNKKWRESVGSYDHTQMIAFDEEEYIFYREGIERDHMQGRIWSPIKGRMKTGRLGHGQVLWGINQNNKVSVIYLMGDLPECQWQ